MKKKVLISVGGTGGHLYPAQALALQLKERNPLHEILFVGGGLSKSTFFDRQEFEHKEVDCSTISLRKPLQSAKGVAKNLKGIYQSLKILKKVKPDIVVGFGSFHSLPMLLAAKLSGIPIVLHEANTVPGRVIRMLSPYVKATGVHFSETMDMLKGNCVEVGIPLRKGFTLSSLTKVSKQAAREYFGLHNECLTILVFGGSQGAQAINKLISEALTQKLSNSLTTFQVLHFTGNSQRTSALQQIYSDGNIKSCVKDFESRMDLAWLASDLMISRSGASTIAELIEFEVPGILIPYPNAMDNHQEHNAKSLLKKVEAGLMFNESELSVQRLSEEIQNLTKDRCALLTKMRKEIVKYKRQGRNDGLCDLVVKTLEE